MREKQITKRGGDILTGTVRAEYHDAFAKLSMDHHRELAVDGNWGAHGSVWFSLDLNPEPI